MHRTVKFHQEKGEVSEKLWEKTSHKSSDKFNSRLRDKYDELSGLFKQAADMEECNETLFNGLGSYSKALSLLADINDMEVQRLHRKVCSE